MKARVGLAIAFVGAFLLVVSLARPHVSAPAPNLGVANGTILTVTLFVNGARIADFPSVGPGPSIDPAALPPLPWTVEARSPSGRVLMSMHVGPGEVTSTTDANGVEGHSGTFGRVDLSCGTVIIWAGDQAPSGGGPPPPSPGTPGDCAP